MKEIKTKENKTSHKQKTKSKKKVKEILQFPTKAVEHHLQMRKKNRKKMA